MTDRFARFAVDQEGPAISGFAVTASDSTVFAQPTRALYVGGTGDVAVRMLDGTTFTMSAVPAGALLPVRVDMVKSTGTTATLVIGLY